MKRLTMLVCLIGCLAGSTAQAKVETASYSYREVRRAVCAVFGSRCDEAMRVVKCESTYKTWAQNGQYLGLFQMGSKERATYGHGSTPEAQARAAYKYFVDSGRTWGPWTCKPWS